MRFTHRDNQTRNASLERIDAAWVVRHDAADGKSRKRSFKDRFDAALRFVLNQEGFILRAPQAGPVQWMTRLMQPYYGEIRHCVDPRSGDVWIVDSEDAVHRVTSGTCAIVSAKLGTGTQSPGWPVIAGAEGSAWVLATSWRKQDGALVATGRLVHVTPRDTGLAVAEIAQFAGPTPVMSLSAAADGRFVGPDPEGLALRAADGEVLRRWPLTAPAPDASTRMQPARAALSRDGAWLAFGAPPTITLVDLRDDTARERPAALEDLDALQVSDAGVVFASGFAYPYHALFRLDDGGLVRVSTDVRATVSADGTRLAEATADELVLRDLTAPGADAGSFEPCAALARAALPVLGMAKYGRCHFGDRGTLVVLTDAYTIAGVSLDP